ncbi:MAG: hypothetical protein ACM358_16160 [Gemmatimonadota bacterium]
MCNTLLFGVISAVLTSNVSAQDTTAALLRRRADSLAAEWRRADALASVADSFERERASIGRDTITAGELRIIANRSPLLLAEAAARAWPVLDSLYGTSARRLVSRPYFIRAYDPDTTATRAALRVGVEVPWDLDVDRLTDFLLATVPIESPDRRLGDWLGEPIRPLRRPEQERARVYVRLVTAPSQVARACFLGEIASCGTALDLVDTPDAFMQWYPSAAERRHVLEAAFTDYFNRTASAAPWHGCVTGNDTACVELLRSLPPGSIPRILDRDARRLLVHMALRIGGREAYGRLLADSNASLGERLGRAAGVPADTVVARWRAAIIASRPKAMTLPGWAIIAALTWTLVLAVCGMQSSRWRVT